MEPNKQFHLPVCYINVGCINKDALMKGIPQLYVFKTLKSLNNRQTEVLTSPFNWGFYTFSVPAAHFYTFMVFTVNSSKQWFGQHFCFSKHTFDNSLLNATLITRAPWFCEITEQSQKTIINDTSQLITAGHEWIKRIITHRKTYLVDSVFPAPLSPEKKEKNSYRLTDNKI